MERIYLTKKELEEYENRMRIQKHLDRYFLIRQFCYGKVIDCASGVGYGSYIIQTNQDVSKVYGIDSSSDAIDIANKEFLTEKIEFFCQDFSNFNISADVLVSMETIEHLQDPTLLSELASRCNVKDVIISFPTKKSTHFNKYHIFDLYVDDIKKIFNEYKHINTISLGMEVDILFFTRRYDFGMVAERKLY